jgi:hypothetical protein
MPNADELIRLLQQLGQSQLPDEQNHIIETMLKIVPTLAEWPLRGSPEEFEADLLGPLGNAYLQRRQGERADNIDTAIAQFEAALKIFTREAFPAEWAMAHGSLAIAYRERIMGERADNVETAIAHSHAALKVILRMHDPT